MHTFVLLYGANYFCISERARSALEDVNLTSEGRLKGKANTAITKIPLQGETCSESAAAEKACSRLCVCQRTDYFHGLSTSEVLVRSFKFRISMKLQDLYQGGTLMDIVKTK